MEPALVMNNPGQETANHADTVPGLNPLTVLFTTYSNNSHLAPSCLIKLKFYS